MGRVSVNNLREGMVLEEDLSAPNGRFILGRGAALKENHIRMFKIWGVTGASVEGAEDGDIAVEEHLREEALRSAEAFIDSYFPPSQGETPASAEIRSFCARKIAGEIASGKSPSPLPEMKQLPRPPEGHFGRTFSAYGLARNEVRLVSFPDIYFKIQEVINSPISSATTIAKVVGKDPSLTARLLRLVNSSFYSFPNPILSIPRAIAIIGANELTALALAVSTMTVFRHVPPAYVDMKSLWKHSIACGVFSRLLAYSRRIRNEERFFLAGLLHDLGRIILYTKTPAEMTYALELSFFERIPLWRAEKRIFGFDHAAVGKVLLEEWNIPESIRKLCDFHHSPLEENAPEESAFVHTADYIANGLRTGTSGSVFLSAVSPAIWDYLGLDEGDLESVLVQGERQIREIMHIFLMA
ncbi:MAG: HDOD domain-containing protein [Aminivibrio sp.]|jgi:HD-like signal output (HDOD) protein|nr:HDOD domain-containing protein [Aminivibrio sp.]